MFGDEEEVPVVIPSVVEDVIALLLKFLSGNPLLLLPPSITFDSGVPTLVATFDGIPVLQNDFEEGGYLTIEWSRVIFTR